MYRINQPQHGADEQMKNNSMTSGLQAEACKNCDEWACITCDNEPRCKDCDEWTCITCDNENCPKDKEPGCYSGECVKQGDLLPKCKDCDEWACITCDNEK